MLVQFYEPLLSLLLGKLKLVFHGFVVSCAFKDLGGFRAQGTVQFFFSRSFEGELIATLAKNKASQIAKERFQRSYHLSVQLFWTQA